MSIQTLEMLRNALLMGVLILLVYVLYKRMLRILGKDEMSKRFPKMVISHHWKSPGELSVQLKMPQPAAIQISLFSDSGTEIEHLAMESRDAGDHEFHFNVKGFVVGRYYYTVKTTSEEISQFFVVGN